MKTHCSSNAISLQLYKVMPNIWGVRCHLIYDMDLDIEVSKYSDGCVCVNIYIADSSCREGVIINKQLDGETIKVLSGGICWWSGVVQDGHFKKVSRHGALPTKIKLLDIAQEIDLTYEI